MVCGFASTSGLRPSAAMALVVSGPMEASLICGNFLSSAGRSNRAWKFSTVELLVNVIQSAPLLQQARRRAVQVLRLRHGLVAGDVVHDARPGASSASGSSGVATSARSRRMLEIFDAFKFGEGRGDFRGDIFLRHQIHLEMQFPELGGGGRADGGDAHAADVAQVLERLEESIRRTSSRRSGW